MKYLILLLCSVILVTTAQAQDSRIGRETSFTKYLKTMSDAAQWQAALGISGSGGTPGGADTQIQFNSAGAFAGSASMTYTLGSSTLSVPNLTVTTAATIPALTVSNNLLIQSSTLTPTTGTVTIDLAGTGFRTLAALTGNITFNTSNLSAGKAITIIITGGASSQTITLPAWILLGNFTSPITLAAGKIAVLSLYSTSTTDAATLCSYVVQN